MKLMFLAFVFFTGFATAVYMLGDVGEQGSHSAKVQFVHSFNYGMHKCFEAGKVATIKTTKFIKQKMDERQLRAQSQ